MEGASHDAVAIGGSSGYQVFRDISRCGASCGSSTVKPALVYFPNGTYLVSKSIIGYYNTQLVGNLKGLPIIGAASSFIGLGATSSNVYIEGQGGGRLWGSDASGLTYSEDAGSFGGEDRNRVVIISTARDGPQG
ncbi:hypothetical protein TWF970_009476 [Orbilia oligospora]|uniref:Rhamnogalacturonase A/B/Epimerase-like pectate lyase domain-containing protein n=1 Tax=Orbilia oligospora TaxID=2813651 RepID=A0A7C8VVC5_ORBOL|nr:hypothetical protein TWF970_009476 [Orbilia oligospora]